MTADRAAGPRGPAIRTLIVDDEPLARERIRALLEADPDILVVGECGDGQSAVALVRETRPDLLFLDIEMPVLDGFETLRALDGERLPFVVFVTAYDRYAVRAFDVHALDYLLKPFDDARFIEALDRAKTEANHRRDTEFAARVAEMLRFHDGGPVDDGRANGVRRSATRAVPGRAPDGNGSRRNGRPSASEEGSADPTGLADPDGSPDPTGLADGPDGASDEARHSASLAKDDDGHITRLVIRRSGRVQLLDVGSIDWFEAADYYVRLHVGPESYLVRMTMKRLEQGLDPARFVRIHRSTIVRIDFIREMQPYFRGEYVVLLRDGTRRSLSRSRRKKLERALGQRL